MMVIPLIILRRHSHQTSDQLSSLLDRVGMVEIAVTTESQSVDLEVLVQSLHACNIDLIKLERRSGFEAHLAGRMLAYARVCSEATWESEFTGIEPGPLELWGRLSRDVDLQVNQNESLKYDFEVLPRRIQNQYTAVSTASNAFLIQIDANDSIRSIISSHSARQRLASKLLKKAEGLRKTVARLPRPLCGTVHP